MPDSRDRYLVVYLQDHLMAATGGIELTCRAGRAQAGRDGEVQRFLGAFERELLEEREGLVGALTALGAGPNHVKAVAAAVGERVGRLKLNGHLLRRSPYSDLVELELLTIAVQGKRAGWIALRESGHPKLAMLDLDRLIEQAEEQFRGLEELRVPRAGRILRGDDPAS